MMTARAKVFAGFLIGATLAAGGAVALRSPHEAPRSVEETVTPRPPRKAPELARCDENEPRVAAFPRSPGGTPEVDAAWLARHRCQVRVIDVREPGEIARDGIIEGAEHVPLAAILDAAPRWSPGEPIVLVCRSGRRSLRAQEQLLSLGFRAAASLTGGMIEWERAGLPVERSPAPAATPSAAAPPASAPGGAPGLLATLRRPDAATWTTAARLFSAGTASCVDGRGEAPIVGTPGGDVGDLILSMGALEAQARRPLREDHLDALLDRYVASFGRFYLHTDTHALERLAVSLWNHPAFQALGPRPREASAVRDLVLAPPAGAEEVLLEELIRPEHIGCGHLRLLSEHPGAYGLRPGLAGAVLKAIFRHAIRHKDALDFVLLEGEHREQGVLLVRMPTPVEAHSRVPMLTPHEGLSEYFVFHPEVAAYLRHETSDFLAEHGAMLGLPAVDRDALHRAVDRLGAQQLDETLKRLAPGLPRFEVQPDEENPAALRLKPL
jgi:rhodanese-related sulfurtransferase